VELPAEVHPFFVGTQAHPELKSRPTRPHPLFAAFVKAALRYNAEDRLPVEMPSRAKGNGKAERTEPAGSPVEPAEVGS
jgi:CTP synthase